MISPPPPDGANIPTWLGGLGSLLSGLFAWFAGRGMRRRNAAANSAATADYRTDEVGSGAAAQQIQSLLARVTSLESSHSDLWNKLQAEVTQRMQLQIRVLQLEGILRNNNLAVPPPSN